MNDNINNSDKKDKNIKVTLKDFKKGVIQLLTNEENIFDFISEKAIKKHFIEHILGNTENNNFKLKLKEKTKFTFSLLNKEFKEDKIEEEYRKKILSFDNKDQKKFYKLRYSVNSAVELCDKAQEYFGNNIIHFKRYLLSEKVEFSFKFHVLFYMFNLLFVTEAYVKMNTSEPEKSDITLTKFTPITESLFWDCFDRHFVFFEGHVFNENEDRFKSFIQEVHSQLSQIKRHDTEGNIITKIVNSKIFTDDELPDMSKIFRLSFILRFVFKKHMFYDHKNNDQTLLKYFSGDLSLDEFSEVFKENIKNNKKALLSYNSNSGVFGINNNIGTKTKPEFEKFMEDDSIKKYLSPESLNLIKTRRMDSHNKGEKYVKDVFSIPFGVYSQIDIDIQDVEKQLNENVYGMEYVKRKILNHIAVLARSGDSSPPILCLAGPPGIGKTTICKTLADSINRQYQIVSCSGVSESFSIIGLPYGYGNPEMGRIMKSLIKAGTMNPLILLDEIDKGSRSTNNGSLEDALIPVLDPGQNHAFEDQYLNIPVDLSQVQFITTVNDLDMLSAPLRDRMVIVEMEGYNEKEKLGIIKKFTLPKVFKDYNIKEAEITLTDHALDQIIQDYGYEPGMRKVEAAVRDILSRAVYFLESGKETVIIDDINEFIDEGQKEHRIGFGV